MLRKYYCKRVFLFFCIILVAFSVFAQNQLSESILSTLKTAPITHSISMRDFLLSKNQSAEFDNEVYLVTLKGGQKAVFKPVPSNDLGDAHAEVAAFKVSQLLGFPKVPPTVIRKIDNKIGSLQLYVESSIGVIPFDIYKNIMSNSSVDEISNLKLFYFVFGQWDTGPHNIIAQNEEKKITLYAIDNAGIRNRQYVKYGTLPFVRICYSDNLQTNDWHLPFPYENEKVIESPTFKKVVSVLGDKFPETTLRKISRRQSPIHYVIYKNSLWVKFHASDPDFIRSYTEHYPKSSIEKLKKLDMNTLYEIFSEAKGSDFLTKEYLNAILERRDQVMRDYENSKR